MTGSQLNESIFEAFFKQAVIDNFEDEYNLITQDVKILSQCSYSAEHEKRMSSLFTKEKRRDNINTALKWSKRVAAIFIITVSIIFGSLMLVPEVRAMVVGTMVEWFDQFARFTSDSTNETKSNLEPTFIPDGFIEEYRYIDEYITTILFINANDEMLLYQTTLASAQLSVDNEGHEYTMQSIDGIEYHILTAIEAGKNNKIIWETYGQRFILSSEIPINDLFTILHSIQ